MRFSMLMPAAEHSTPGMKCWGSIVKKDIHVVQMHNGFSILTPAAQHSTAQHSRG